MSPGTIVVGVDGSQCSDAAVTKAIELAAGLGDALVVVYAVEPPFRGVGDEWKESQQALQELGAPIVEQAVARGGRGRRDGRVRARSEAPSGGIARGRHGTLGAPHRRRHGE